MQPWSMEQRLQQRFALVTLGITLLTCAIIGYHYGRDIADLRQRKVLEQAELIAETFRMALAGHNRHADIRPMFGDFFETYSAAYGWRLLDGKSRTIASSAFKWDAVNDLPQSSADEWTHELTDSGWAAGKRFACGADTCEIQVVALSDPAHLLSSLILGEITVHVLVPILPFAALILLTSGQIVRSTLKPLRQIGRHARELRELKDVKPIRLADAPSEVLEVAATLNETLERLGSSAERETAFVLDAAHSLRTPLAALALRLEVERTDVKIEDLRADISTLTRLSEQLLDTAHVDRLVLNQNSRIDLEYLIVETISRLNVLAHKSNVSLAFEKYSQKTLINADKDSLAIALTNLLENAIQNAPRGSEILVALHGNPVRVTVNDSGPGIPKDQLESVVTRFSRISGAKPGGAGLGLFIVSRIMEAHKGALELRGREPNGLAASLVFWTTTEPDARHANTHRSTTPSRA